MGIKPEQDVIVYCFKGSRASNTLMQLRHAGFKGTTTVTRAHAHAHAHAQKGSVAN
jgi:3-mercaptopyruvate sulfurtransferase SseA